MSENEKVFIMEGIVKYDHDSRYLTSYVEGEDDQDLSVELNKFHGKKVKVTVEVLD
jgi:hypothetical protein